MSSDEGMPNWMKQARAASHIRELLIQRGVHILSQNVTIGGKQWMIFEHEGKQVGVERVRRQSMALRGYGAHDERRVPGG